MEVLAGTVRRPHPPTHPPPSPENPHVWGGTKGRERLEIRVSSLSSRACLKTHGKEQKLFTGFPVLIFPRGGGAAGHLVAVL